MKLDRNVNPSGLGKYGLFLCRNLGNKFENAEEISKAIQTLQDAGLLDMGGSPERDFFVIRLMDVNAEPALRAYAQSVSKFDAEFALAVHELAFRASRMARQKQPDALTVPLVNPDFVPMTLPTLPKSEIETQPA